MNNLYVLILLHVVCFYFAFYSSILVGAVGLSQYYASAVLVFSVNSEEEGGSSGNFRNFKGGLRNFQDPGGCSSMGVGKF